MNESLFIQYIKGIWPKLGTLIERINGKRGNQLTYLHKTMMRTEYSADQKWESASINTTFVAADMVAMDSPLPPKKRDSIAHSNGKLPKLGMKKVLSETDINTINVMKAQGARFEEIVKKLTNDAVACSVGIDEKNEMNFLTALSDGYVMVEDTDNTGTALRVSFNFPDKNCFGVETKGELTLEDIKRVISAADNEGDTITTIAIAKSTYDELRGSRGARELVANYKGQVYTKDSDLPTPTASIFDEAFADDNNGVKFLKIDRSIKVEKNGKQKSIKPFSSNKLTFLTTEQVGAIVWSNLAEATNKVNGVEYQTIDSYKLISKYSKNEPSLQEVTAVQALVLPVLENVDQIYSLDINEGAEVNTTAESSDTSDIYVTINSVKYTKSGAIDVLKSLGANVKANSTDATVIAAYNTLSVEDKAQFLKDAATYVHA